MRKLIAAVLLAVLSSSAAEAATIFQSLVRQGPIGLSVRNDLTDTNMEYIVQLDPLSTSFQVGDIVEMYLSWDVISTSDGFYSGTDLDAANAGGANYRLLSRGQFVVSDIGAITTDVLGREIADISFNGALTFYERNDGFPPAVDFASITTADTYFVGATELFTVGTASADDFILAEGAFVNFDDIPTSLTQAVRADFGFSFISGIDFGLVPDALVTLAGPTGAATFHDFVGFTNAWQNASNQVIGPGDDRFDLQTNTSISFRAQVPEPSSFAILGLMSVVGCVYAHRQKRKGAAVAS